LVKSRRILSIDDDPDVTLTLKTILENDGYIVDVFNDPTIAVESLKKAAEDTTSNEE
jgi:CheY-like chemotaxis protein